MNSRTLRFARTTALVAAAAAPVLAQAQAAADSSSVVVYGLIDAAVRRADNVGPDGTSDTGMEDGTFTGSRLGLRGREDLGGGLAAVFTLESGFDPSTGDSLQGTPTADYGQVRASPRFWGREVHMGLSGAQWGLTLGRQYTLAHAVAARFQPQGNPNNTALSVFSSHHVARQDNVARADVRLGGVALSASHTFGEVAANGGSDAWALAAQWTGGPVFLGGYYQEMRNLADTERRRIAGLGGNWKVAPIATLYAGAMRRTNEVSPQENTVWTLGTNVDVLPQLTLTLAHLSDRQRGSAALHGSRQVTYGAATYRLSKRTDVAAIVDHNALEGGYAKPAFLGTPGSQTAFTVDVRHRF